MSDISVFISYSHEDSRWLEQLRPFLDQLSLEGGLDYWDDRRIQPGRDWRSEIRSVIQSSDAAVLLVSQPYLASDFIRTNELPPLLERAQKRGLRLFQVIVSPCNYDSSPLARFQALNPPTKTLVEMHKGRRDRLWLSLAKHLSLVTPAHRRERPAGGDDSIMVEAGAIVEATVVDGKITVLG